MEYIQPKEFLEQPKKVQENFRNWWKPEMYALFFRNFGNNPNNFMRGTYIGCIRDNETLNNATKDKTFLPILIESQLRKYINDKTGGISSMQYNPVRKSWDIYANEEFFPKGNDLLQAYFQVACEIAEKE